MTTLSETLRHLSPPDRIRAQIARLADSDAITVDKADLLAILDTWQDAAVTAWWAWDRLSQARTLIQQAGAVEDLANAMSDLGTWLPGYDSKIGGLRSEDGEGLIDG